MSTKLSYSISNINLTQSNTKYNYENANRVVVRSHDGGLDVWICFPDTDSLQARSNRLFLQSLNQVNSRVPDGCPNGCDLIGGDSVDELPRLLEENNGHAEADVGMEYEMFGETMHQLHNLPDQCEDSGVYFYHSVHLGSASWITDSSGNPIQHLQYLPFGEPYIDQRASNYHERFTFTGKEKDEETGYGYFGARYMDHELMTMWLSVDPMADRYPGISPYAYCAWNPVKLVDPDGRELVLTGESENVNTLLKIINSCFSFSSDVFKIVDGKVQSRELTSDEMDNMSVEQREFYNTVMSAINDGNTISIDVVNNSKYVLFGSWESSSIDVADMIALGDGEGMNMYSVIGHEIAEQQYKQTSSRPNYLSGHYRYGMKAEENISGRSRGKEFMLGRRYISIDYSNYSEANRLLVTIHLGNDYNVESVNRIKLPLIIGN